MVESVDGEFTEVQEVGRDVVSRPTTALQTFDSASYAVVASQWNDRMLTPPNHHIPIPDYLGPNWTPDWAAIPDRTPVDEIREALNDKTGAVMYKFVTTGYVLRMLDKLARGHNWGDEIIWEGRTNESAAGYEYVVVLQIVMPGLFRPVMGVGSNKFQTSNPQDTDAKTRAGAHTAALKNAAKQLGIGRDLEEADPEFVKLVETRYTTINSTYERLRKGPLVNAAQAIIREISSTALLEDGTLLVTQVDFDKLNSLQKELSALAVKAAQEAKAAATTATPA